VSPFDFRKPSNVFVNLQKNWQQAMECLSLTLEEIVHIRSVLTKAELESLPVEGHVKDDVEKRKVRHN
jgi:spire-like protein